jgi:TolA-binding protein
MTDPEDPSRLFDSPDAPKGLRDSLRAAREDVGSDQEVARLATRLGPLLGPAAPIAPGTGATAAGAGGGLAAKLGLGALALVIAGGGAWLLSAQNNAAPPSAPTNAAPPPPLSAPLAPPPAAGAPIAPAAPSADSAPTVAPSVTKPSLPSKPVPAAPPSEAELLEQARAALKAGDSARALQRASEHAQRFPRGVLVQEREVLAIQALRRLGRDAEADRRADAFAKAFPGSAFQRKLTR